MHLIIEEAYITIKGFLKHLSITFTIYFVKHDTNYIFFFKGSLIITCIYTYAFSCLLDFSINTSTVISVTQRQYNISLAFHQLDSDG